MGPPVLERGVGWTGDGQGSASGLDPLVRSLAHPLAQSAPPFGLMHATPSAGAAGVPAGCVELARVEEAVRRIAWGGDRRRGVARIELGGELGGTAIIVRGEGREVSLEVERGRGDAAALAERVAERLSARGLTVTGVEIR